MKSKYYCSKCKSNHFHDSKIGREHSKLSYIIQKKIPVKVLGTRKPLTEFKVKKTKQTKINKTKTVKSEKKTKKDLTGSSYKKKALKLHNDREYNEKAADIRQTSSLILSPYSKNDVEKWSKNKNRIDLKGIDDKGGVK